MGFSRCTPRAASVSHLSSLYSSIGLPLADDVGAIPPPDALGTSPARVEAGSCVGVPVPSLSLWSSAESVLGPGWAADPELVVRPEGAALAPDLDLEGTAIVALFFEGRRRPLDCAARTWSSGDGESNWNGSAEKSEERKRRTIH